MSRHDSNYDLHRHRDDHWLDEVRLVGPDGPALRLVTRSRYKTSALSGDEWRTSTAWQHSDLLRMQGDEVYCASPGWYTYDGGWHGKLEIGCAALYPGLYSSQQHAHSYPIERVEFLRKGRALYSATYDGEPRPLLTLAGHLPWALVTAGDQPTGTDEAWADFRRLCHQPGCCEPAVSTYRLRKLFNQRGDESPAETVRHQPHKRTVGLVHRFCSQHLRRGDCGLQDADANYEVMDGPARETP